MDIRLAILAGGAGLAITGAAVAQDAPNNDGANGWGGSFTVENDMFVPGLAGTDRYFTQGLKATFLTATGEGPLAPLVQRLLPGTGDGAEWEVRQTFGLGQNMYTPENKVRFDPDPDDRPYAGWLYVSTATIAYSDQQMASLELQVGVVGPMALAGRTQNWWHEIIEAPSVNGWDHELHNEPGVNLYGEWRRRLTRDPQDRWGADIIGLGTAALGNVETSAGLGGMARIGFNLNDDFGPPRLRPGAAATEFFTRADWSVQAFAGAYGRVVGRDIFLDGNTFRDSPSVDKEAVIPELTAGVTLRLPAGRLGGFRLGYQYVWRDEEFAGQNGASRFGALSLTFVTRGLR